MDLYLVFKFPTRLMLRFDIEFGVSEKRWNGAYYKHMDKVVNEGRYATNE